jgi:spermidine/putrescine transport system ATP-binding protein
VSVPGSTATIRVPTALVDGRTGRLSVGVRPEKIRLLEETDERPANANVLEGVVTDASYQGVSTQYIVRLKSGEQVTVYEQNVDRTVADSLWRAGENVTLSWTPDHTFAVAMGKTYDDPEELV